MLREISGGANPEKLGMAGCTKMVPTCQYRVVRLRSAVVASMDPIDRLRPGRCHRGSERKGFDSVGVLRGGSGKYLLTRFLAWPVLHPTNTMEPGSASGQLVPHVFKTRKHT